MGVELYRGQQANEAATALMMEKNEAAMATMMETLKQVPKQPSAALTPQFEPLEPAALDKLFPRDAKLTPVQRGFRDWSEGMLPALDAAWWQALTAKEKARWEDKWLTQLSSTSEKKREVAIRCLAIAGCKKAVPEILKIAAERVEKDNADRQEAVRALGILGDMSLVPELVPLTYHYNMNTRLWAQVSLVRLPARTSAATWPRGKRGGRSKAESRPSPRNPSLGQPVRICSNMPTPRNRKKRT